MKPFVVNGKFDKAKYLKAVSAAANTIRNRGYSEKMLELVGQFVTNYKQADLSNPKMWENAADYVFTRVEAFEDAAEELPEVPTKEYRTGDSKAPFIRVGKDGAKIIFPEDEKSKPQTKEQKELEAMPRWQQELPEFERLWVKDLYLPFTEACDAIERSGRMKLSNDDRKAILNRFCQKDSFAKQRIPFDTYNLMKVWWEMGGPLSDSDKSSFDDEQVEERMTANEFRRYKRLGVAPIFVGGTSQRAT